MTASHNFLSPAELEQLRREYETIRRNIINPPSFEEWIEMYLKNRARERVASFEAVKYAEQRSRYKE